MTTPLESMSKIPGAAGTVLAPWRHGETPPSYGDPVAEYRSLTNGVAIYDASHLGRIKAVGADFLDLLNRLSTNKVDNLAPGQGAPTVLTSDKGRIIDLVYTFNLGPYVLLLTGAGAESKVMQWMDKYTIMEDSVLEDVTRSTALITVAGPEARSFLETLTGVNLESLRNYGSLEATVGSTKVMLIRMGADPPLSFQLVTSVSGAEATWKMLTGLGAVPVGTMAWKALRIKTGVPVYGREMDESYNPLEAGLIGAIDFDKGCYIGQEVIARLDTYDKVQKVLVSLKPSYDAPIKEGESLTYDGKPVGVITSLARIPGNEELVSLGYVRMKAAATGNRLGVDGSSEASVEVTGIPKLFDPK